MTVDPFRPMRSRLGGPARAVALVLSAAACAPAEDGGDTDALTELPYADPSQPGPYPVGIRTVYLPDVAGYTQVPVEVWYPASQTAEITTSYDFLGVSFTAEGYRDVAPDPDALNRVVAFSHGLGGARQQNYAMAERLASHGFVVVAPDHPGTTTIDFLASFDDLGPSVVRRPAVIRAAVDAVRDGIVPGLAPSADTYALIGHSLGALTAMTVGGGRVSEAGYTAMCASAERPVACDLLGDVTFDAEDVALYAAPDARVMTTVLQSPGGNYAFEAGSLAGVPHPLVMGATLDTILPYEAEVLPVFDQLSSPAAFVTLVGAGHYGYTNMCDLSVATLFAPDCEGAAAGFVDPVVVRASASRYVMAWIGSTLGGQDAFLDDLGASDGADWQTK